jgi:hypothetical protein
MSKIIAFPRVSARNPVRLTALDLVIARFAREHDQHVSPIVGCYLCLHGLSREIRVLRIAA